MADLAAALDALTAPVKGPPCTVGTYLAELAARDEALHARVLGCMADAAISNAALARALAADGAKFLPGTLGRHRRRGAPDGCRCSR